MKACGMSSGKRESEARGLAVRDSCREIREKCIARIGFSLGLFPRVLEKSGEDVIFAGVLYGKVEVKSLELVR